jgi:hypothetical protein
VVPENIWERDVHYGILKKNKIFVTFYSMPDYEN